MEEFSDLDDETGTNIVQLNNVEIARNIVEPIEYNLPELTKTNHRTNYNNLYSNLNNNNIINFENPFEIKSFDDRYFSKRYLNDYDRFIDENLTNNARIFERPYKNNNNICNNINESHGVQTNNNIKENHKMNRLIEIQKNYNKANHKKVYYAESILNENKENKPLNPPDNAFSSIN